MEGSASCGGDRHLGHGAKVPDQAASQHQSDGDQLGSAQRTAEDRAPAGVVADELEEETRDTVQEQIRAEDLPLKLLSHQQPAENEEDSQLDSGLKQLCRLECLTEGSAYNFMRQGIGESNAPEVIGRLSVAASGGEAAEPANGVAHGQSRGKGVAGTQGGHFVLAHEPCCYRKCRDQASREHASCLQGFERENLAEVFAIDVPAVPIQDDVKDLGPEDAGEHHGNAEIPGIFRFEALLF